MAETARAPADEKEFFDDKEVFDQKVSKLAELIAKCNHCVAFSGAGISTSAGIKDFRSGINTKLQTGAGVWALDAAKLNGISTTDKEKDVKTTSMLSAIPSLAHMAIVELMNKDKIKFCISQNVDGLHIRSGVPRDKIAELHGNTTIEICEKCGTVYCRDFDVVRPRLHKTGRNCSIKDCNGDLVDTIINFGENLPEKELNAARDNTKKGDLCIALGSSLTVSPACDLAQIFGEDKDKDLVIVNLQKTPLDDIATIRINGKIDDVMQLLMNKLDFKIPKWKLKRQIVIKIDDENNKLFIDGMDESWKVPMSIFKGIVLKIGDNMQFKGDSKWIKQIKNEYNKNKKIDNEEELKKNQLIELKLALKKCDKSLQRYAKMIFDAGYTTVESLGEFRMGSAVAIMDGSNNYERRKIVDTFSKPIIKDMDQLLENIQFKFNRKDININNNDDEKEEIDNYIIMEFAKHYNEKNLKLNVNKYIETNKNEYQLNITFDLDTDEWTVQIV